MTEAATQEQPPPPPTIEIGGQVVPVSEVAPYFDPACPRRCEKGGRKTGLPAPRPYKGVIWTRQLCPCAVEGWEKAHPVEVPIIAGPAALRAAAHLTSVPAGNPWADQVARLRAQLAVTNGELEGIQGEIAAAVADLETGLRCAMETLDARTSILAARAGVWADLRHTIGEVEAELDRLRTLLEVAADECAAADAQVDDDAAEVVAARARVEAARAERGPQVRAIERKIEKLQRRISSRLLHHPEADGG